MTPWFLASELRLFNVDEAIAYDDLFTDGSRGWSNRYATYVALPRIEMESPSQVMFAHSHPLQ